MAGGPYGSKGYDRDSERGSIASTSSLMTRRLFETIYEIRPGNVILDGEALWAHIQETASRYPTGQLATILVDSLEILEKARQALVDSLEILTNVLQPLAGNGGSNGPATFGATHRSQGRLLTFE